MNKNRSNIRITLSRLKDAYANDDINSKKLQRERETSQMTTRELKTFQRASALIVTRSGGRCTVGDKPNNSYSPSHSVFTRFSSASHWGHLSLSRPAFNDPIHMLLESK